MIVAQIANQTANTVTQTGIGLGSAQRQAALMPSSATERARRLLGILCGGKFREYGWDVPTPAQMREDLAAMEKRPFDGLIFRLSGGHNAFVTKPLEPASFAEDDRILRSLQFTRLRDNFVLIWGSPPADFDWFNDSQWEAIEANAKLLVDIAQVGAGRLGPDARLFRGHAGGRQPQGTVHRRQRECLRTVEA